MAPTDLELLAAWRDGDRQAGGKLFDRHFSSVRRFFRSKVGDDYEELAQATFMRCTESQLRFRADGSFRAFLFAIAWNVLREHLRQRQRDGRRFCAELDSAADMDLPGPSTVAGARREQVILLQALRRLPLQDQVVLELFYWEQMTSAQMAEVLDVPHGTVRSRLRLARDRLRGHVDELARTPVELDSTLNNLERWAAELRQRLA